LPSEKIEQKGLDWLNPMHLRGVIDENGRSEFSLIIELTYNYRNNSIIEEILNVPLMF
jgi:hypothetical protein